MTRAQKYILQQRLLCSLGNIAECASEDDELSKINYGELCIWLDNVAAKHCGDGVDMRFYGPAEHARKARVRK